MRVQIISETEFAGIAARYFQLREDQYFCIPAEVLQRR